MRLHILIPKVWGVYVIYPSQPQAERGKSRIPRQTFETRIVSINSQSWTGLIGFALGLFDAILNKCSNKQSRILLELVISNERRLEFVIANECRLEFVVANERRLEFVIANERRLEFVVANERRLVPVVVYIWSAPKIRDLSILFHPIRFVYHCELMDKTGCKANVIP